MAITGGRKHLQGCHGRAVYSLCVRVVSSVTDRDLSVEHKELFDFVHTEYRAAFETNNVLYGRCGFVLSAQVLIAGATVAIGRHDLMPRLFERPDTFLYYLAIGGVFICLAIGLYHVSRCVIPKTYPKVVNMSEWIEWWSMTHASSDDTDSHGVSKSRDGLLRRVTDATDKANEYNAKRFAHLKHAIRSTVWAGWLLGVQGFFALVLKVQGVVA